MKSQKIIEKVTFENKGAKKSTFCVYSDQVERKNFMESLILAQDERWRYA